MIRRTSLRVSLIAVMAVVALVLGAGLRFVSTASAQQQPAPAQSGRLQDRVSQLEQRILELQSVIATLQTFTNQGGMAQPAAGGTPAGGPGGGPNELSIRVLALETQIRALTGQMDQLNRRLNGADAPPGPAGAPQPGAAPLQPGAAPLQPAPHFGAGNAQNQAAAPYGAATQPAPLQTSPAPVPQERPPWQADPNARAPSPIPTPPQTAGLPPLQNQPGSGAQAAYDFSYQSFLRNDLQSAESGFRSFVQTYPDDQLASNAYYWLGRTHFARQQFEPAAKAFLAGYKKNKKSPVAPDNLLHLGKSLAALGEKQAACSTLKAVKAQFPAAPNQLRQDVTAEMKRAGC